MNTALAYGLQPTDGHWPSRIPSGPLEGLLLKAPDHPTFYKTVMEDQKLGYSLWQKDGRLYSFPVDPGGAFTPVPNDAFLPPEKGKK